MMDIVDDNHRHRKKRRYSLECWCVSSSIKACPRSSTFWTDACMLVFLVKDVWNSILSDISDVVAQSQTARAWPSGSELLVRINITEREEHDTDFSVDVPFPTPVLWILALNLRTICVISKFSVDWGRSSSIIISWKYFLQVHFLR